LKLRSDLKLWQRIYLRLVKPIHDRKIAQNVEQFSGGDAEYAEYVESQMVKTRGKRFTNSRFRIDVYIDLVLNNCKDLASNPSVLNIGPRNHHELDSMTDRGLSDVTGVDLWPTDSRIVKGDMHDLPFEDDQFDLVFASHVFEHSYDFAKVANQVQRVVKKNGYLFCAVPIDYEEGPIDRVDFGTFENFVKYFPDNVEKVLSETATGATNELLIILKFGS
jgi:SAM-dependent methyltransferase